MTVQQAKRYTDENWLFYGEAVKLLGKSRQRLTQLVDAGIIDQVGNKNHFLYSKNDILAYLNSDKTRKRDKNGRFIDDAS